jgi:hypothetical protein
MPNVVVETGISLQDYLGVRGSIQLIQNLDDGTTLAELVTAGQTLQTTLDAATGAAIVGQRVTVKPALAGGLKAAVPGADLERTLLINFAQSGLASRYGIDIPGINPAHLSGGRPNPADAAVIALVALIEGNYTSAALNALTAVRDYATTFRKHKRGLDRVATVAA